MTQAITPKVTPANPLNRLSIKGRYEAQVYDGQWVVQWTHNHNPWHYAPPGIIAHCESEAQAKAIKRALQNSINTQRRKHQQQ